MWNNYLNDSSFSKFQWPTAKLALQQEKNLGSTIHLIYTVIHISNSQQSFMDRYLNLHIRGTLTPTKLFYKFGWPPRLREKIWKLKNILRGLNSAPKQTMKSAHVQAMSLLYNHWQRAWRWPWWHSLRSSSRWRTGNLHQVRPELLSLIAKNEEGEKGNLSRPTQNNSEWATETRQQGNGSTGRPTQSSSHQATKNGREPWRLSWDSSSQADESGKGDKTPQQTPLRVSHRELGQERRKPWWAHSEQLWPSYQEQRKVSYREWRRQRKEDGCGGGKKWTCEGIGLGGKVKDGGIGWGGSREKERDWLEV